MPSTTVSDLIERVADKEQAGVGERKVCAEFEGDLPDVVEPFCEGVDGLGEELFPAGAFLDEGAFGVTRELEEEGGDLCLFRLQIQGGHADVPSVHVHGGCGCPVAPFLGDEVEQGREVLLDEKLLRVGGETVVDMEEPGSRWDNRTGGRVAGAPFARCCVWHERGTVGGVGWRWLGSLEAASIRGCRPVVCVQLQATLSPSHVGNARTSRLVIRADLAFLLFPL